MNPVSKGTLIYLGIVIVVLLFSTYAVVAGWQGGGFQKKISQNFKQFTKDFNSLLKDIEVAFNEDESKNIPVMPPIESTSIATSESEITEITSFPTEVPSRIKRVIPTVNVDRIIPTVYVYPTIAPGELGSAEWEEQFRKNFEETTQRIEESRRRVEEQRNLFCSQNPDLCN